MPAAIGDPAVGNRARSACLASLEFFYPDEPFRRSMSPPPSPAAAPEVPIESVWETYGAWLWLIGIVQFAVTLFVVQAAYGCANHGGCYNLLTDPISNLGSGGFLGSPPTFSYGGVAYPWPFSYLWPVFNYSIFVLGTFLFAGALLSFRAFPRTTLAAVGIGILALSGLAAAGVGVVPEDTLLAAHAGFALLAFLGAGLATLLIGISMVGHRSWNRSWSTYTIASGLFSLAWVVLLVLPSVGILPAWPRFGGGFGYGGVERMIIVAPLVWLAIFALRVLRRPRGRGPTPSEVRHPSSARRWEIYGALTWLLGLLSFVLVMVAAQLAYPCSNFGGCYDPLTTPISALGSAGYATGNPPYDSYLSIHFPWPFSPWWPAFNYSIVLFGIALVAGAFFVRRAFPPNGWATAGFVLLAIGGMGAAGVGLTPEDTLLNLHIGFAAVAFLLAAVAVIAFGVALAAGRSPWGQGWTVYTLVSGLFALAWVVLLARPEIVGVAQWVNYGSGFGFGGLERLIVVAPFLWIALVCIRVLRHPSRGSARRIDPSPSV